MRRPLPRGPTTKNGDFSLEWKVLLKKRFAFWCVECAVTSWKRAVESLSLSIDRFPTSLLVLDRSTAQRIR